MESSKKFTGWTSWLFAAFMALSCLGREGQAAERQISGSDFSEPRPIDGISIYAVENLVYPGVDQIQFSTGIYPFNPYTMGFTVGLGYLHRFSDQFAWEVVNLSYVFSVDKALTLDLADHFGVNPKEISRLSFMVNTNAVFPLVYGKALIFGQLIRYFRFSALVGGGMLSTQASRSGSLGGGAKLEFYANETFSWVFDSRAYFSLGGSGVGGSSVFPTFSLGVSMSL